MKSNLLDLKGHHILVEREPEIIPLIKKKLAKSKIDFDIQECELYDVKTTGLIFDYMHLDTCGGPDYRIGKWINQLDFLERKGELNLTFTYAPRGNFFLRKCKEEIFSEKTEYNRILKNEYSNLERNDTNIAICCAIIRCLLRKYNFGAKQPIYYKDTVQSMVLYPMFGFTKTPKFKVPDLLAEFTKGK